MLTGIDHLVIRVADLAHAREEWSRHFHVVPGGQHSTGSENALIGLGDGSYLELLGFAQETPQHPWWHLPPGLIDFCAATPDLDRSVAEMEQAGFSMQPPFEMSRLRPDGVLLRWRLAQPIPSLRGRAPFLIADLTPREQRVPSSEGPRSLASLTIFDPDAEALTRAYNALLGPAPWRLGPHRLQVTQAPVPRLEAQLSGGFRI